jgi:hypothetical protein
MREREVGRTSIDQYTYKIHDEITSDTVLLCDKCAKAVVFRIGFTVSMGLFLGFLVAYFLMLLVVGMMGSDGKTFVFPAVEKLVVPGAISDFGATTLLVSVEPCSTPDGCGFVPPPRHRPAGYPLGAGGAVFNTACLVASLGEPRSSAMSIAPR